MLGISSFRKSFDHVIDELQEGGRGLLTRSHKSTKLGVHWFYGSGYAAFSKYYIIMCSMSHLT